MSETPRDAAPNGDPKPDGSTTAPTPGQAEDFSALNDFVESTDDTPTIISRAGPHRRSEEPPGGLRGRKLAHFELIEPIGVGGMAAVIRARDTQLDRLVALKILPPDMANDPENVRRFHQEARSAARLDHENIARVFFCGEDQRLHFIAFEFVEGDNLRTILERRGRLPFAEALHYILQVAAGLAHASQRGVVHRDIKPSNIIITPTGRAKLVDMGLARSMERQDDKGLTQSGVTLGTFDYISPEQALEPREADVRSDIYSLGCTLYHVLTGRPPVPDGTAAKKLHHHQHVKPRDPRELVPGLPDEAAVILDRMMAKRPQDRYQSPEQLVQHLLLAASKLGNASNVPEGVLSVEAALPPAPAGRPLLLAGLAAALVVAVVVAVEAFNRAPPTAGSAGPVANAPEPSKPDLSSAPPVKPPAVAVQTNQPADVPTPPQPQPLPAVARYGPDDGDLVEWLKNQDKNAPKEIVLGGDLDLLLSQDSDAALLALTGPKVTIQAAPGKHPTIRFSQNGPAQVAPSWVGLSIDSPNVKISGVRFLVDEGDSNVRMVGLRLHAPASAVFNVDNCEFIQARPGAGEKRLASLQAATETASATLNLSGCRFFSFQRIEAGDGFDNETLANDGFGGDVAIIREGPVRIQALNCAFGPHAADFRLEGGQSASPLLTLNHCSVLAAGPGAVFDIQSGAAVDIHAQASLFSHPSAAVGPAFLIRQPGRGSDAVCNYTDDDSRYHGFDAFCVNGDQWEQWPEAEIAASSVLKDSPWSAADPLKPFRRCSLKEDRDEHFADAFQINESSADLRIDKTLPVGVKSLGLVDYVEALRRADKTADAAQQKRRTVDPNRDDSSKQIYKTLAQALAASEPGDEILLSWDGPQQVDPIRLDTKKLQDVTIRADKNRRPQLLLAASQEPEPAMFRVFDGKLRLEGLEFVLRPDPDRFDRQSLIDLVGQGQCSLKNCIVTLDGGNRPTRSLAVAWLSDPSKGKMMQPGLPADQAPLAQLTLESCFIRGDGNLITCQPSRPFTLNATNTLAALNGSFLSIDAGSATPPGADVISLNLTKVTAYVSSNLVSLHAAKEAPNFTPVQCTPKDCLIVAAAGKPMIYLNAMDLSQDPDDKKGFVTWLGPGRIDFGNFSTMFNENPPPNGMAVPVSPSQWDSNNWGGNTVDKQMASFHWATDPPKADDSFSTAMPLQFRPDPADGCGADAVSLDRQLFPTAPK
ncbi:MAG TPA: serine/threonine-protein kinase [Gemmataceae bacterium]|nr:serine/threonine-protein kinase [Gemmataceae bacterium]